MGMMLISIMQNLIELLINVHYLNDHTVTTVNKSDDYL